VLLTRRTICFFSATSALLLHLLTHEAARTLVHAFISSRLDYCNSLLYGLPHTLIGKVQSVQNAAAQLLSETRRGDHISSVLRQLHWLPVQRRVDFKLACFGYSSLSGQAPPYLADDIHLVSDKSKTSTPLVHRQIVCCSTDTQHIWRQKLCCRRAVFGTATASQYTCATKTSVITVFSVNSKRFGFNVASGVQCDIPINCAIQILLLTN